MGDKKYIKVITAICVFYILITLATQYIPKMNHYKEKLLDSYIKVSIMRNDGTVEYCQGKSYPIVNRGDKVIIVVDLPEQYKIPNAALCFQTYNSIITVKYKEKELYRYGDESVAKGRQIGAFFPNIPIPDEAFGNQITIECDIMENRSYSQIYKVTILSATESLRYPIIDKLPEFLIFITIFIMSVLIFIILIFMGRTDKNIRMGIFLALFSSMISCYVIAYYGMFNVISNDFQFNADIEYIMLFFLQVPLISFFKELVEGKYLSKVLKIMIIVSLAFAILCTILNFSTTNYHYSRMVVPLHILMGIQLVILVGICVKEKIRKYPRQTLAIDGILIFSACMVVELIRFNLDKYRGIYFNKVLIPIAVMILITMFVLESIERFIQAYDAEKEKEQLEKLAYLDPLTGLVNRTKCEAYLKQLKDEQVRDYTIIVMDLNDLKTANDHFGHTAGDQYIKKAAYIFQKCFREADICGRMGGDEFIVIYKGKFNGKIDLLISNVKYEFQKVNQSELFKFRVSVACGNIISTEENPVEIEEAISIADEKMYKNKAISKQA